MKEKDSETQALVLVSMAKALCNQEKFVDCKRCLEVSLGILDKRERICPVEVAEAYSEISMQYETMNEFETAISLLKRTLALLEKQPQEQHSEGSVSARIGWLLLLTGKVQQAIPYLESAAERLKDSFGPKHLNILNPIGIVSFVPVHSVVYVKFLCDELVLLEQTLKNNNEGNK